MSETQAENLLAALKAKLGDRVVSSCNNLGHAEITIDKVNLLEVVGLLQSDSSFAFNMLLSVTAVDYLDHEFMTRAINERFEVVYHLMSLSEKFRLRVKVPVSEDEAKVASLVLLYPGANFMESEVWDMYGISFEGHPGLRRVLMYEEFKGYPLRKDYPIQGKQPRIPLRHAEVENTARLMQRPNLVQIGGKSKEA